VQTLSLSLFSIPFVGTIRAQNNQIKETFFLKPLSKFGKMLFQNIQIQQIRTKDYNQKTTAYSSKNILKTREYLS
jgi:hypothetical protein